jgi:hypothetical protein
MAASNTWVPFADPSPLDIPPSLIGIDLIVVGYTRTTSQRVRV